MGPPAASPSGPTEETPARLIVFDLPAGADGKSLVALPLRERRIRLEAFADRYLDGNSPVRLSPFGRSQPRKPKLLAEVCYRHFTGERFRHGTRLLRWRLDKRPRQCTWDQVERKVADPTKLLH